MSSAKACNLGLPRIGKLRELKFALEKHWNSEIDRGALLEVAKSLRREHWQLQVQVGIGVPSFKRLLALRSCPRHELSAREPFRAASTAQAGLRVCRRIVQWREALNRLRLLK